MKRLTYKNYIEEYEVNFEKSSDKNWSIAESDTHIKVTGEPIDKLGELEDVLEKYGIESAEDLDNIINSIRTNTFIDIENKEILELENANLKNELAELKQKAIVPKKIVNDFYDEIRHRAILEDDYCPDHKLERKYGVRKCLLENIRSTILKKYGGEDE